MSKTDRGTTQHVAEFYDLQYEIRKATYVHPTTLAGRVAHALHMRDLVEQLLDAALDVPEQPRETLKERMLRETSAVGKSGEEFITVLALRVSWLCERVGELQDRLDARDREESES